ncbi:glycine, alanine and asparagine-rich protein-like [Metopolophium dirhodum]|uniref:glycine, alanine and asparagine-rich protein-like n=1 Tax=Metopolophium dirhodum TaxID=44670 RepID=UPI0029902DFD|nr:glycine, alanine and asparagine-rich protein-like [Metopolophium dirhodum]
MRNDQLPEDNAESERTPNRLNPGYMDYTPLVILQQRLNALESNYGNQNPHDDSIFAPRIARVSPMPAGPDNARRGLPSIHYQASATFDISALHLQNPTAATFSNAAAAVAASTPVAAMRSAVRIASNPASYSTASSNTATYSTSPIRYTSTQPSLYCIASTSRNGYYSPGSASNSDTESATSTETISASEHDYDTIPPFRRRALALDINDAAAATAAVRRRALDENEDEDMIPRKKAKRSMHHVIAVNRVDGNGNFSGNGSGSDGNGSGVGRNGSGIGGNGNGVGGNGSGVGGNGSGVGGNGENEIMDCEL